MTIRLEIMPNQAKEARLMGLFDRPGIKKTKTNIAAVMISINGKKRESFFLQYRQRPLRLKKERIGIKSFQPN